MPLLTVSRDPSGSHQLEPHEQDPGGASELTPTQLRIALFVIVAVALGVWLDGARHYFLSCAADCGEAFDALQYVANFHLYGLRYGLVQDMATSAARDAHPFFYTHNVNIAGILFTLLDLVGIGPLWAKQLLTLAAFGAGLFYVFRSTALYTRSWLVAMVVLFFFATDYDSVLRFGLNPLRAWHWLAIFGIVYYATRLAVQHKPRRTEIIAVVLLGLLAFGIGYDLWVVCALIGLGACVVSGRARPWRSLMVPIGWILAAFLLPLLLRQVQIAAVLGPSFWLQDLYYSVAVKVSLLNKILPPVDPTAVDAFYRDANVLRPPATPASSLNEILGTLRDMLEYVTIPSVGLATFALGTVAGVVSILVTAAEFVLPDQRLQKLLVNRGASDVYAAKLLATVRLIGVLSLGIVIGVAVFAPLSFHIYLKYGFPLVVGPLLVVKGAVLGCMLSLLWGLVKGRGQLETWRLVKVGAAAAVACFLVADHAVVQIDDIMQSDPLSLSWIDAVAARQGSTFAVSWIPNAVSVFSHNWAVGVPAGHEDDALARLRQGRAPFDPGSYALNWERNAEDFEAYLNPNYWLYFPTDQLAEFDQLSPTCRQDYLTQLLTAAGPARGLPTVANSGLTAMQPEQGPPGTSVSFTGALTSQKGRMWAVMLLANGKVASNLSYNCEYGTFAGRYTIPEDASAGVLQLEIRGRDQQGETVVISRTGFTVDPSLPRVAAPAQRMPQPSVDDILRNNPDLPIAAGGQGWVLFDLRNLMSESILPQVASQALYVATTPNGTPEQSTIDERGARSPLPNPGIVWLKDSGQLLGVQGDTMVTKYTAAIGRRIRVLNVGPWDATVQRMSGADIVFDGTRWTLDPSTATPAAVQAPTCAPAGAAINATQTPDNGQDLFAGSLPAVNCNNDFRLSTDSQPLAFFDIAGLPDARTQLMQEDDRPFVRVTATHAAPSLLIYSSDSLSALSGRPVRACGEIRAGTPRQARLTLHLQSTDGAPPLESATQVDLGSAWAALCTPLEIPVNPSPGSNFSIGLADVNNDDYFDVRNLSLLVGAQQPANVNARFDAGPRRPLAGWTLTADAGAYDVQQGSDDGGTFVRVRALRDLDHLLLVTTEPLAHITGIPLSIRGQIRVHGSGKGRLTLSDQAAPNEPGTMIRTTDQEDQWVTLNLQYPATASTDPSANVALGVYGMASGDYFDLREFSVLLGGQP